MTEIIAFTIGQVLGLITCFSLYALIGKFSRRQVMKNSANSVQIIKKENIK